MFMLDIETILASGLGAVLLFFLHRGYVLWRKWSNKSKVDDEIDIDREIAEAIKNGDAETIARLKKYYQMYMKRCAENGNSGEGQSVSAPESLETEE